MAISFKPLVEFDAQSLADFQTVGPVHFYVEEHRLGNCALFAVLDSERRVGSILFCSETKPETGEKIMAVMAASTLTRRSLINEGKDLISRYAKNTGHDTVKFYTDRPRLAYEFVKMGARAKITWSV